MKSIFSLYAFLLASTLAFGQIEWVGNHCFFDTANDLIRTSQGNYVLLHGNGSGLTVFNDEGNILFEDTVFTYTSDGQSDLIELPDSSFVFLSGGIDCDVFFPHFLKYDKNWNRTAWKLGYGSGSIAKFSDNSMATSDGFYGYVEKLSPNGDQFWILDFFSNNIHDLLVVPGDTLLVVSEAGIIKADANGVLLDTLSNLVFQRLELLPNGHLLALADDTLSLLSPDFMQLATYHVQGETINDIAVQADEIAVLTSAPTVVQLDFALTQIGATPLSGHNQVFTSVTYAGDGFLLGGAEQFGNNSHQSTSAFVKSFASNGNTLSTAKDIALTQIGTTGQVHVEDLTWMYAVTIPALSITIENKGTTPIHRLSVNLGLPDAIFSECYENQSISKPFENLDLQPGAALVLDWGELLVYFNTDPTGQALEICAWTSLPNHHLETNNDNDIACLDVVVATTNPSPFRFTHSFNAMADVLYLELGENMTGAKANIFNAAGQLIHAQRFDGTSNQWHLGELPDGSYFLQVIAGEQVGWEKFAKY